MSNLAGWDSTANRKFCVSFAGPVYEKVCDHAYFRAVAIKYGGMLSKVGTNYAVFTRAYPDVFDKLVVFNLTSVNQCERIQFSDMNTFDCRSKQGILIDRIRTERNILVCLPFHFALEEELRTYCLMHPRGPARTADQNSTMSVSPVNGTRQLVNERFTLLYYAYGMDRAKVIPWERPPIWWRSLMEPGSGNCSGTVCSNVFLLILSVLLIMLLIRRYW